MGEKIEFCQDGGILPIYTCSGGVHGSFEEDRYEEEAQVRRHQGRRDGDRRGYAVQRRRGAGGSFDLPGAEGPERQHRPRPVRDRPRLHREGVPGGEGPHPHQGGAVPGEGHIPARPGEGAGAAAPLDRRRHRQLRPVPAPQPVRQGLRRVHPHVPVSVRPALRPLRIGAEAPVPQQKAEGSADEEKPPVDGRVRPPPYGGGHDPQDLVRALRQGPKPDPPRPGPRPPIPAGLAHPL